MADRALVLGASFIVAFVMVAAFVAYGVTRFTDRVGCTLTGSAVWRILVESGGSVGTSVTTLSTTITFTTTTGFRTTAGYVSSTTGSTEMIPGVVAAESGTVCTYLPG